MKLRRNARSARRHVNREQKWLAWDVLEDGNLTTSISMETFCRFFIHDWYECLITIVISAELSFYLLLPAATRLIPFAPDRIGHIEDLLHGPHGGLVHPSFCQPCCWVQSALVTMRFISPRKACVSHPAATSSALGGAPATGSSCLLVNAIEYSHSGPPMQSKACAQLAIEN